MKQVNYCPICNQELPFSSRYPNYLCKRCSSYPVDEDGRTLKFWNESISGGFDARYIDTNELRDSHICYVNGRKCWAEEARMGGIVIQLLDEKLAAEKLLPNESPEEPEIG